MRESGICYLVGAGPGDPELITVRGLRCLRRADVVYHDHLVAPELLAEAPPEAEVHDVGKTPGQHPVPQDRISARICDDVRRGRVVVRLKGGDPFVFGRGGEEALALSRAGLPFEIVPGVTAGVAAAACAGIPVTHRGISTAVTLVSGHEAPDKTQTQTDWGALAQCRHTLCIYMGMKNLPAICRELIQGGRPATEWVAVVEWGTRPHQRTVVGTLADIHARVEEAGLHPPALVVVGEVVGLADALPWFADRRGRRDLSCWQKESPLWSAGGG